MPVLKSSSSTPVSTPTDPKPPRRTYKPRGSRAKEQPGKPGRKPNSANALAYSHTEYSLQGKGRILSPKPAPTHPQMGYPPSGYPPQKFALPSNSSAQTSYLKPYTTASSTPSPLRSQSRPPYDPRDIHNPTWAPVGYTYGGPNPPPSQFPSSGDYKLDQSRPSPKPPAPFQQSPGYGPYNPPLNAPIRGTPGAPPPPPPPHPFLPPNTTPTSFTSQSSYYTPSPGYAPPYRPYPPSNSTWSTPSSAQVLQNNGTPTKPYEPEAPPQFIRAPITPKEVVKYYVGDGVYKTAPSTIERQLSLPPSSQGTVFEEDSYSKDLNRLARNGNWGSGGKPGSGPIAPS